MTKGVELSVTSYMYFEEKARLHAGREVYSFTRCLKTAHRQLTFNCIVNGIPETRTIEAKCIHRIKSTSERNRQIITRSGMISMQVLNISKIRRKGIGKKVFRVFIHRDPGMKFIDIVKSKGVSLCQKWCSVLAKMRSAYSDGPFLRN